MYFHQMFEQVPAPPKFEQTRWHDRKSATTSTCSR